MSCEIGKPTVVVGSRQPQKTVRLLLRIGFRRKGHIERALIKFFVVIDKTKFTLIKNNPLKPHAPQAPWTLAVNTIHFHFSVEKIKMKETIK